MQQHIASLVLMVLLNSIDGVKSLSLTQVNTGFTKVHTQLATIRHSASDLEELGETYNDKP